MKEDTLFAFPSYDGSPNPRYRLYPDNNFAPTPWITDHWGWLSVDMTVRKPPHTIRVGIVGDSTSHNNYGFYLQGFLNAWARARNLGVVFEVANGGRQGFGFDDAIAVMKYEMGPMGLDYVVEYFAPSFSLNPAQMAAFAKIPGGAKTQVPASIGRYPIRDYVDHELAPLAPYSAVVKRVVGFNHLLPEPAKPPVELNLPGGGHGQVSLQELRKDPYFGRIARQLDQFKTLAESQGSIPFVCTERLFVWDGLKLRNDPAHRLYQTLNGANFWPFTYADLRRMVDAHNGTITAWAQANRVPVIDIDGRMPHQADLYADPWHDTVPAQSLRAWLIFQAMVPRITEDLRNHTVPHDNSEASGVHPYLDKPIERMGSAGWLAQATRPGNN